MSTQSTQLSETPASNTLYVICHGAIATLQTGNNFILLIPDMGAAHSYRAGTWLTETSIEKGSLNILENVSGGNAAVLNLMTAPPRTNTSVHPPFATFILPRPSQIYSLFQVKIAKSAFIPADGSSPSPTDLVVSYVPVFQYSYGNTAPRLGNIWPVAGDTLSGSPAHPQTLHIFAEDETPLDDNHAVDAFNRTCKLLNLNMSVSLQSLKTAITAGALPALPPGLETRAFEFQPLHQRREALLKIALAKQNGSPIVDPWSSIPSNPEQLRNLFIGKFPENQSADLAVRAPIEFIGSNPSCLPLDAGTLSMGGDD